MLLLLLYAFPVSSDLKSGVDTFVFMLKCEELETFTPLPSLTKLLFFQREDKLYLLRRPGLL